MPCITFLFVNNSIDYLNIKFQNPKFLYFSIFIEPLLTLFDLIIKINETKSIITTFIKKSE